MQSQLRNSKLIQSLSSFGFLYMLLDVHGALLRKMYINVIEGHLFFTLF